MIMQLLSYSDDAKLTRYNGELFSFFYPEEGRFARFSHNDGTSALHLIVDLDNDTQLRFTIEDIQGYESAQSAAQAMYRSVSDCFNGENVAPSRLELPGIDGWRCRKRFVDGAYVPLIIDYAFLEVKDRLYRIMYAANPIIYQRGRWIFDTIIQTFSAT